MVLPQSLQRTLEDVAQYKPFLAGSLRKLLPEVPGYATYERNGQFPTTIGNNITAEEIAETVDNQVSDSLILHVFMNERTERCEKAVRHRLAVDAIYDIGHRQSRLALEIRLNFF